MKSSRIYFDYDVIIFFARLSVQIDNNNKIPHNDYMYNLRYPTNKRPIDADTILMILFNFLHRCSVARSLLIN